MRIPPVTWFLALPYIGLLWVPFYNRALPALFGIPFFYWYQIAWILLGSLSMLPVYLYEERRRK
jgi:hypothetical protein